MQIIFDSSTLILLAKIDLLRTVTRRFECTITEDVKNEATRKLSYDSKMITELLKEGKIKVEKAKRRKSLEYEFNLDEGEASALSLAHSRHSTVATDDKPTINACKILNIGFVTAIDFLIMSFKKGEIDAESARIKIEKLDEYGRYTRRIIEAALKKIGGNR